jgi:hypothetical protein
MARLGIEMPTLTEVARRAGVPEDRLPDWVRAAEEFAALPHEERVRRWRERQQEWMARFPLPDPVIPVPDIPARFKDARLDRFRPANDTQRSALEMAHRFVADVAAGKGRMLAYVGETEAGKSYLMYSIAHALYARRLRVYAASWLRLGDDLRYGARREVEDADGARRVVELEPWQVRNELWAQRIILLDEVRETSGTRFDEHEVAKLAGYCWDQKHSLCITTNVPLRELVGPAVARRFTQVVVRATPPTKDVSP